MGEKGKRDEGVKEAKKLEKARLDSVSECDAVIARCKDDLEYYKAQRDKPLAPGVRIGARKDDYVFLVSSLLGTILKAEERKSKLKGLDSPSEEKISGSVSLVLEYVKPAMGGVEKIVGS